jgi:outer membrane protein assembly factor BamB/tetratricopeptide (TPR) repeat protein
MMKPPKAAGMVLGLILAVGPLLVSLNGASAQPPNRRASRFHPDASFTAQSLLRNAATHVEQRQWAEAIAIYQRVINEFGETVAQVPQDDPAADPLGISQLYVDARQDCHRRLAELPAEALAVYRRRVDPEAERWFRQGQAERDRALLRKVVDIAFCSSWGDDALNLLGDIAFREGRFGEALVCYRRIVPDEGAASGLVYPDSELDPALIAAKKLLCRAAMGEVGNPDEVVAAFARSYADAKGSLAGRTGPLKDSLAEALRNDGLAAPAQQDSRWTTFAGAPSRTRIAPAAVDVGSFQWKVRLEPIAPARPIGPFGGRGFAATNAPPRADRGLAYHPIVVGDQVIYCDGSRLVAHNLSDRPVSAASTAAGEAEVKVAWAQALHQDSDARLARMALSAPRYTVTAHGDRIYARLGPSGSKMGANVLLAVRNDREVDGKLLWRKASNDVPLPRQQAAGPGRYAVFEGSPVVDRQNVYIGLTEAGTMTALYVACLDADTGAPRWVRFLGEATPAADAMAGMPFSDDVGSRLLSFDGATLYYQTNLGVVAALDAETGGIRWLATYPQREGRGESQSIQRDLNPAVVHNGLVIVAPDDSPEIFALDAATGRLLWRNAEMKDVVHLLGVARGRVVATGNHVYFLDVATGKTLSYWPQSGAGYQGYGRGLLAGDQVYWPTRNEIHVLDQATGLKSDRGPIPLQQAFGTGGGNLAVGDGYLIVAQEDALVVFCQNSRLIDRLRELIVQVPDNAVNYVRLARVAEATGQDELALESLDSAVKLARAGDLFDGQPLADQARSQRFSLLMRLGSRAVAAQDWDQAARRFAGAAESSASDRDRLAARLLLAESLQRKGDAKGAVGLLQDLLAQEPLRGLAVQADDRRTVRADLLITERLAGLLRERGRALYDPYERQAQALLERGKRTGDPRLLEEVERAYPVSSVVPEALLSLAAILEARKQPAEAARAYKRLLTASTDDASRARALLGLGRCYEAQGYWVPARDALARAQARHGEIRLDGERDITVGSLVAERLASPPFDHMTGDLAEPALELPLVRSWNARWSQAAQPLAAEGVPPSAAASRIFLAVGTKLRPIDLADGHDAWTAELGGEAVWLGYLADRLVAATENRLVALDVARGTVRWSFDGADPSAGRRPADPFRRPSPADAAQGNAPAPRLHGFRIVGNRIFCGRGDRELLALDGDSGLIDWSYSPASRSINAHFWVGPRRTLIQVRDPNAILVLDTDSGQRRAEFPQQEQDQPWPRDPLPVDDDHAALVSDARTITLFDMTRGTHAWTYREPSALPRSGPPRLIGDAGRLLALRDGSELVRLDLATGERLWSRLLGVEDLTESPDALALDGERIYCATGRTLTAYRLADGTPQWRHFLNGPATGWAVALTDRYVAAYPRPARPLDQAALDRLPLVLCRRDTGRLVQRLLFDAPVSRLAVRLAPGSALIATQEGAWALASREKAGRPGAGRND